MWFAFWCGSGVTSLRWGCKVWHSVQAKKLLLVVCVLIWQESFITKRWVWQTTWCGAFQAFPITRGPLFFLNILFTQRSLSEMLCFLHNTIAADWVRCNSNNNSLIMLFMGECGMVLIVLLEDALEFPSCCVPAQWGSCCLIQLRVAFMLPNKILLSGMFVPA